MSITDDIDDVLHIFDATVEQIVARIAKIGDRGTAGPDEHPAGVVDVVHPPAPRWDAGWWAGAIRKPAHPGRIGGAISPWSVGVHSTDMLPEEWPALVNAWTDRPGDGACATFLFGRTEQDGVLQFCPITRNANHMGGPGHGVFDTASASGIHPNLVATGIELHCAGGVRLVAGEWRLVEGGIAHGKPLPARDVIPDPHRPGRGWHVVTDYQRAQLELLLHDLEAVLAPMPAGARTRAFGEVPPAVAVMPTARVVTHWQMDPVHRGDPWQPTCEWLRSRST